MKSTELKKENAVPKPLDKEYEFFERHRAEWAREHEGKFALIVSGQQVGFYEDYESAYHAAIQRYGLQRVFLIHQVWEVEPTAFVFSTARYQSTDGLQV